ncbi:MAG: hypothetical protein ACLQPD_33655 [Desulfomonilaceae bacterium]
MAGRLMRKEKNMEVLAFIGIIVAVGAAFLAFILPFKMIRDVRRAVATGCYENCMRVYRWQFEEAPACMRDCRLQEA